MPQMKMSSAKHSEQEATYQVLQMLGPQDLYCGGQSGDLLSTDVCIVISGGTL